MIKVEPKKSIQIGPFKIRLLVLAAILIYLIFTGFILYNLSSINKQKEQASQAISQIKPENLVQANKSGLQPGGVIAGNYIPNSTVKIVISPNLLDKQVKVSSVGKWSVQIPLNAQDGIYNLSVMGLDENGQIVNIRTFPINIQKKISQSFNLIKEVNAQFENVDWGFGGVNPYEINEFGGVGNDPYGPPEYFPPPPSDYPSYGGGNPPTFGIGDSNPYDDPISWGFDDTNPFSNGNNPQDNFFNQFGSLIPPSYQDDQFGSGGCVTNPFLCFFNNVAQNYGTETTDLLEQYGIPLENITSFNNTQSDFASNITPSGVVNIGEGEYNILPGAPGYEEQEASEIQSDRLPIVFEDNPSEETQTQTQTGQTQSNQTQTTSSTPTDVEPKITPKPNETQPSNLNPAATPKPTTNPEEEKPDNNTSCSTPTEFYCDGSSCIKKSSSFNNETNSCSETYTNTALSNCPNNCQDINPETVAVKKDQECKNSNPTQYYCDGSACIARSSGSADGFTCTPVYNLADASYCNNSCTGDSPQSERTLPGENTAEPEPGPAPQSNSTQSQSQPSDVKNNFFNQRDIEDNLEPGQSKTSPDDKSNVTIEEESETGRNASWMPGKSCRFNSTESCENGGYSLCHNIADDQGVCPVEGAVCESRCGTLPSDIENLNSRCENGVCINPGGFACGSNYDCRGTAAVSVGSSCKFNQTTDNGFRACIGKINAEGECSWAGGDPTKLCTADDLEEPVNLNNAGSCAPGGICVEAGQECLTDEQCAYTKTLEPGGQCPYYEGADAGICPDGQTRVCSGSYVAEDDGNLNCQYDPKRRPNCSPCTDKTIDPYETENNRCENGLCIGIGATCYSSAQCPSRTTTVRIATPVQRVVRQQVPVYRQVPVRRSNAVQIPMDPADPSEIVRTYIPDSLEDFSGGRTGFFGTQTAGGDYIGTTMAVPRREVAYVPRAEDSGYDIRQAEFIGYREGTPLIIRESSYTTRTVNIESQRGCTRGSGVCQGGMLVDTNGCYEPTSSSFCQGVFEQEQTVTLPPAAPQPQVAEQLPPQPNEFSYVQNNRLIIQRADGTIVSEEPYIEAGPGIGNNNDYRVVGSDGQVEFAAEPSCSIPTINYCSGGSRYFNYPCNSAGERVVSSADNSCLDQDLAARTQATANRDEGRNIFQLAGDAAQAIGGGIANLAGQGANLVTNEQSRQDLTDAATCATSIFSFSAVATLSSDRCNQFRQDTSNLTNNLLRTVTEEGTRPLTYQTPEDKENELQAALQIAREQNSICAGAQALGVSCTGSSGNLISDSITNSFNERLHQLGLSQNSNPNEIPDSSLRILYRNAQNSASNLPKDVTELVTNIPISALEQNAIAREECIRLYGAGCYIDPRNPVLYNDLSQDDFNLLTNRASNTYPGSEWLSLDQTIEYARIRAAAETNTNTEFVNSLSTEQRRSLAGLSGEELTNKLIELQVSQQMGLNPQQTANLERTYQAIGLEARNLPERLIKEAEDVNVAIQTGINVATAALIAPAAEGLLDAATTGSRIFPNHIRLVDGADLPLNTVYDEAAGTFRVPGTSVVANTASPSEDIFARLGIRTVNDTPEAAETAFILNQDSIWTANPNTGIRSATTPFNVETVPVENIQTTAIEQVRQGDQLRGIINDFGTNGRLDGDVAQILVEEGSLTSRQAEALEQLGYLTRTADNLPPTAATTQEIFDVQQGMISSQIKNNADYINTLAETLGRGATDTEIRAELPHIPTQEIQVMRSVGLIPEENGQIITNLTSDQIDLSARRAAGILTVEQGDQAAIINEAASVIPTITPRSIIDEVATDPTITSAVRASLDDMQTGQSAIFRDQPSVVIPAEDATPVAPTPPNPFGAAQRTLNNITDRVESAVQDLGDRLGRIIPESRPRAVPENPVASQVATNLDRASSRLSTQTTGQSSIDRQLEVLRGIRANLDSPNPQLTPQLQNYWEGLVRDAGRSNELSRYQSEAGHYYRGTQATPDLSNPSVINYIKSNVDAQESFLTGLTNPNNLNSNQGFIDFLRSLHTQQAYKGDQPGVINQLGAVNSGGHEAIARSYVAERSPSYQSFLDNPAQTLYEVRLPGISTPQGASRDFKLPNRIEHEYPTMDNTTLDQYAQQMRLRLQMLNQPNLSMDDQLRLIGEFYQYGAISRPFNEVNNSLFMNMVNGLLEQRGLTPIEQGFMDFAAMRMQPDEFTTFFRQQVQAANRNMSSNPVQQVLNGIGSLFNRSSEPKISNDPLTATFQRLINGQNALGDSSAVTRQLEIDGIRVEAILAADAQGRFKVESISVPTNITDQQLNSLEIKLEKAASDANGSRFRNIFQEDFPYNRRNMAPVPGDPSIKLDIPPRANNLEPIPQSAPRVSQSSTNQIESQAANVYQNYLGSDWQNIMDNYLLANVRAARTGDPTGGLVSTTPEVLNSNGRLVANNIIVNSPSEYGLRTEIGESIWNILEDAAIHGYPDGSTKIPAGFQRMVANGSTPEDVAAFAKLILEEWDRIYTVKPDRYAGLTDLPREFNNIPEWKSEGFADGIAVEIRRRNGEVLTGYDKLVDESLTPEQRSLIETATDMMLPPRSNPCSIVSNIIPTAYAQAINLPNPCNPATTLADTLQAIPQKVSSSVKDIWDNITGLFRRGQNTNNLLEQYDLPITNLNSNQTRELLAANTTSSEFGERMRLNQAGTSVIFSDPSTSTITKVVDPNATSQVRELIDEIDVLTKAQGEGGLPNITGVIVNDKNQVIGLQRELIVGDDFFRLGRDVEVPSTSKVDFIEGQLALRDKTGALAGDIVEYYPAGVGAAKGKDQPLFYFNQGNLIKETDTDVLRPLEIGPVPLSVERQKAVDEGLVRLMFLEQNGHVRSSAIEKELGQTLLDQISQGKSLNEALEIARQTPRFNEVFGIAEVGENTPIQAIPRIELAARYPGSDWDQVLTANANLTTPVVMQFNRDAEGKGVNSLAGAATSKSVLEQVRNPLVLERLLENVRLLDRDVRGQVVKRPQDNPLTVGERSIQKKHGHAQKNGNPDRLTPIPETQAAVEEVITEIMTNPSVIIYKGESIEVYGQNGIGVKMKTSGIDNALNGVPIDPKKLDLFEFLTATDYYQK